MIDREKVIEFLGEDWKRMGDLISEFLSTDIKLLDETNRSILSHNGKMLRPMLSLLMSRACGSTEANDDACRFAAASEMLHNATLLHDDVADQSNERRGFPTTASVLGGPASVLLGDFWLVKAELLILSSTRCSSDVIRIFAKTLSDLAEGEMLQLQKSLACDTTEEDYFRIVYSKTASLFEAACKTGAIAANAPEASIRAAVDYAVSLGIAFQIKDDILDYVAADSLGKPVGVDLTERKITLPLLGVLRDCSGKESAELRGKVSRVEGHPEYVEEIRKMVIDGGGIEYATGRLDEYVERSKRALDVLPDSPARSMLLELADFTAYRQK